MSVEMSGGMNKNILYVIIILACIVFGIITFNYYAYISAGNKSALSAGAGASFKLLPLNDKEHFSCDICGRIPQCNHVTSEQGHRLCNMCLKNCQH
jgi:hypothetical protein